ncbi:Spo0E family sporulation regulatory protein-aspartic acid phosphatase [Brevibacillus formosus]|uniref:aspartyl-phosphate phosphatase Spo0E family protein n=1 Tax=Brevibacillus formosus TaxID=54913 RepID=UPI001C66D39E|nr:aspartyl-phosphate phosphatase Spo0E family protein [Brevibacillus formosus]MBW5467021.1 Spo0E family sporulation regulatory protein-aspartic acid phosphatase [Brevibacillus formosus]
MHLGTSLKREVEVAPKSKCTIWGAGIDANRQHLDLETSIEQLRQQMIQLAGKHGLTSDVVLGISQQLDKYIVMAQNNHKTDSIW